MEIHAKIAELASIPTTTPIISVFVTGWTDQINITEIIANILTHAMWEWILAKMVALAHSLTHWLKTLWISYYSLIDKVPLTSFTQSALAQRTIQETIAKQLCLVLIVLASTESVLTQSTVSRVTIIISVLVRPTPTGSERTVIRSNLAVTLITLMFVDRKEPASIHF
jgi:hypothetical protein